MNFMFYRKPDIMIRIIHKLVIFTIILSILACKTKPITPNLPNLSNSWHSDPENKISSSKIHLKWWQELNDKNLDWLIEQANQQSPDIKQAIARINEARSLQKTSFAQLFPNVTANGDSFHNRSLFLSPISGNGYNAHFDASYELDLFGKNRYNYKASDLETISRSKDYEWVRLTTIAEIVKNYVLIQVAEKQINLAKKNLNSEEETLALVKKQQQAGASNEFDISRIQMQVNQSKAQIQNYKRQKEILLLSLVTLTGITPQEIYPHIINAKDIPNLKFELALQAPAQIIANRPDINAANLRFNQATYYKKSQAANIFPNLTIAGLFGISKSILVSSSSVWNIAANSSINIIDFGRIRGQIDAASAREMQAYEIWRKAILQGVQDVESALTNVIYLEQQINSLQKAKENATKALNLARIRYKEGDSSLLDVLDAQRQLIEADISLTDTQGNYTTSMVALYKALGQY